MDGSVDFMMGLSALKSCRFCVFGVVVIVTRLDWVQTAGICMPSERTGATAQGVSAVGGCKRLGFVCPRDNPNQPQYSG